MTSRLARRSCPTAAVPQPQQSWRGHRLVRLVPPSRACAACTVPSSHAGPAIPAPIPPHGCATGRHPVATHAHHAVHAHPAVAHTCHGAHGVTHAIHTTHATHAVAPVPAHTTAASTIPAVSTVSAVSRPVAACTTATPIAAIAAAATHRASPAAGVNGLPGHCALHIHIVFTDDVLDTCALRHSCFVVKGHKPKATGTSIRVTHNHTVSDSPILAEVLFQVVLC
mmetsp:Transcript_7250/g.19432  ORF Transcript_7250/g.19432 Transcript_7250/m.19432 type:complete len:225 (-) Transcript_7250:590-1264(-)